MENKHQRTREPKADEANKATNKQREILARLSRGKKYRLRKYTRNFERGL